MEMTEKQHFFFIRGLIGLPCDLLRADLTHRDLFGEPQNVFQNGVQIVKEMTWWLGMSGLDGAEMGTLNILLPASLCIRHRRLQQ